MYNTTNIPKATKRVNISGDTVQLTEIDSQTPVKTVLYGARIDSTEYVLSFFDDKCGMPLYLSEHEIDDMCRVEKS